MQQVFILRTDILYYSLHYFHIDEQIAIVLEASFEYAYEECFTHVFQPCGLCDYCFVFSCSLRRPYESLVKQQTLTSLDQAYRYCNINILD